MSGFESRLRRAAARVPGPEAVDGLGQVPEDDFFLLVGHMAHTARGIREFEQPCFAEMQPYDPDDFSVAGWLKRVAFVRRYCIACRRRSAAPLEIQDVRHGL